MKIMRTFIFILFCFMFVNAQDVSFMPKRLNLDSIVAGLPKLPEEVIDSSLIKTDFKQFALDSGKICPKNGILISGKKAAEFTFYKLGNDRYQRELKAVNFLMNAYLDQATAAEKIYQARIALLEKECKRNWFERNNIYIGFACGIAVAILTERYVVIAAK